MSKHPKRNLIHHNLMRFRGVVDPRVWRKAKKGDRDAIRWIIEDLEDLARTGGFVGNMYARAARRVRNIELCMR